MSEPGTPEGSRGDGDQNPYAPPNFEKPGAAPPPPPPPPPGAYGQPPPYGQQPPPYGQQPPPYGHQPGQPQPYGEAPAYGQPPPYGQPPGYGQPPPYGQPAYGAPPGYGAPVGAKPPTYLIWALVNLLICWPVAIVAIVYATKVNSKYAAGDYAGALAASQSAKQFAIIGTVLGLIALAVLVSTGNF